MAMTVVALMPMRIVRVVMSFMVAAGLVGGLVRPWGFATPWEESYFFGVSVVLNLNVWIAMSGWTVYLRR